jgi:hypothetical protein
MREADYRKAQDAGKGGVANTGLGVGNEFVLTNASPAPAGVKRAEMGAAGPHGRCHCRQATERHRPGQ